MANIIFTRYVGFHVMGHGPKLPSCKLEAGGMTLSTSENSKILKSHGLMTFAQSCPYMKNVTKYHKIMCSYGQGMSQK